jgi:hypothetical protein
VLTRRAGFLRRERPLHLLPVLISDAGPPALSSTGTLSVRVCACDADGGRSLCGEESSLLRAAGLSPAALLSILACLLLLLGEGHTDLLTPPLVHESVHECLYEWVNVRQ